MLAINLKCVATTALDAIFFFSTDHFRGDGKSTYGMCALGVAPILLFLQSCSVSSTCHGMPGASPNIYPGPEHHLAQKDNNLTLYSLPSSAFLRVIRWLNADGVLAVAGCSHLLHAKVTSYVANSALWWKSLNEHKRSALFRESLLQFSGRRSPSGRQQK